VTGYALLIPELLVLVAAFWALFAERLPAGDRGSAWVGAALSALAAVAAAAMPISGALFGGMLVFDGPARFARTGVAVLAALWLLWTAGRGQGRIREAVALAMFSAIGAMLMAEAAELVTLVLAVELATMPAYVLIGYRRMRLDGLEGALKYFLLSMLTSLVMLYGMSFLYGVTGTSFLSGFDLSAAGTLGVLAVLFTFVGLFAKLSAAPFHYWAPDAYAGAEPWTVAFVSTVPKLTAVVAVVRLASAVGPTAPALGPALLIAAVASMVLGNLAALTQTDIRRMMAYSGVAHTGYLLLAISTLTSPGYASAIFYVLAYSLPSLGVMLLTAEEGPALTDFAGLSRRRMGAAWLLVVMLVSLVGIPPLAGFFGKLYLFSAAISDGLVVWVLVAVAMSVVSAGYYLRIVRSAFLAEDDGAEKGPNPWPAAVAVATCAGLTLALGIAASPVLTWMGVPLP